ncbi:MAG: hypothetical protein WD267_11350 [Balneolales bacterium]
MHFINDLTGWAVGGEYFGNGIILYTEDGGVSWQEKSRRPGNIMLVLMLPV